MLLVMLELILKFQTKRNFIVATESESCGKKEFWIFGSRIEKNIFTVEKFKKLDYHRGIIQMII